MTADPKTVAAAIAVKTITSNFFMYDGTLFGFDNNLSQEWSRRRLNDE
jgi:hypothetical protein